MAILEAGTFDDIISWTPDGLSFVVSKPKALVEVVFPLYFKKEVVKYSSFTRKVCHKYDDVSQLITLYEYSFLKTRYIHSCIGGDLSKLLEAGILVHIAIR